MANKIQLIYPCANVSTRLASGRNGYEPTTVLALLQFCLVIGILNPLTEITNYKPRLLKRQAANFNIMYALKNKVQLIGNLGNAPEVKTLESGKKMARFSLATSESYRNAKGEKVTETQWHTLVAWGKVAEIAEKYLAKGKEILVEGKLINRSYNDKDGNKKYICEVQVNELLLLGEKTTA